MYFNQNKTYLENKLNRPVQDHELYIAHNLGPGGARSLLSADPNAKLSSVLPSKVRSNNPMFFRGVSTVQEAIDRYKGHLGE
jgi:hypothetical protein